MAMTMLHTPNSKVQSQGHETNILLLSKFTEKSSKFQSASLSNKVFKTNSDQLDKIYIQPNKKSKKSVLTLPNEPNLLSQECTVSDYNDSDYFKKDAEQKSWRNKCQFPVRYNKSSKQRMTKKDDQVALWKSLDNESDEKKVCKSGAQDVWALLRNMNRFQFQSSPPMSDDNYVYVKQKNKNIKKNRNTRIYEACRTEEIEYTITSYDVDTAISNDKPTSACVGQSTRKDNINSFKQSQNKNSHNKRSRLTEPGSNEVKNKNKKIRTVTKNCQNDQGDVVIDYNLSTETLKNRKLSSNSTLTKYVRTASIGSATSSKFYSNIQNPQEIGQRNIKRQKSKNNMESNTRNKLELIEKRSVSLRTQDNSSTTNKYYKRNEGLMYDNKSSNLIRISGNRPSIHKVEDYPRNSNICCKLTRSELPLAEVKRTSKFDVTSDNTKTFFNIYRGKVDQASLIDFDKSNLAKCSRKLSINDVRSKLSNMRFPIVVTGRDQISPVKVDTDTYCQFSGFDTQIWPFMIEWMDSKHPKCKGRKYRTISNTATHILENMSLLKTNKNKFSLNRYHQKADEVTKTDNKRSQKTEKNILSKTGNSCTESSNQIPPFRLDYGNRQHFENVSNFSEQSKSMNFKILKNKMKRLLQKKSTNTFGLITLNSDQPKINCSEQDSQRLTTKNILKNKRESNAKVCLEPDKNVMSSNTKINSCQTVTRKEITTDNLQSKTNYTKSKNKFLWAKAKWANDVIDNVIKKMKNGLYYVQQIQQPSILENQFNDLVIPNIRDATSVQKTSKIIIKHLPGFDVPLPALVVESLSMKEICIKQCLTNLTIRFDVIIPTSKRSKTLDASIECLPTESTGLPNILKCQTTIMNTVLPAELCSVIPKMLRKISENNFKFSLPMVKMIKTEPQLATITELVNRCESRLPISISRHLQKIFSCTSSFGMESTTNVNPKIFPALTHCSFIDTPLLNKVFLRTNRWIPCNVEIPFMIHSNTRQQFPLVHFSDNNESNELPTKICTDNNMTVSVLWKFDIIEILKIVAQCHKTQKSEQWCAELLPLTQKTNENICNNLIIRTSCLFSYEIIPFSPLTSNQNNFIKKFRTDENGNKYYRLCKIKNLEDFLQILGTGLADSSVFDEKAGKKIMWCVIKMRKWLDEINIKQAMLIILLTNNCDSQDMVKFGPKLLKSVAKNIITNTRQLNKEIDVIMHRKLLEGDKKVILTSYTEKGDLFQELYWIAKSAAKHSHGTFDENAEEKLKVFLEKRRQLNPSFLRAMATYLGLGLLKIDLEKNKVNS